MDSTAIHYDLVLTLNGALKGGMAGRETVAAILASRPANRALERAAFVKTLQDQYLDITLVKERVSK